MRRTSGTGNQRGFTLLELLVVLAILVLLTVALPVALPRLMPSQQLRVDAASLAAALRLARDETVLSGHEVALRLNASHSGLVRKEGAPFWTATGGADVRWSGWGSDDPQTIRFWPDGSVSGGALQLMLGGRSAEVTLSPMTGRVAVAGP
jgi:general secretion pathway protein H